VSDYYYAERADSVLFEDIETREEMCEVINEFYLSFGDKLAMFVGHRDLGVSREYETVIENEYEPELTLFKVASILCEDSPTNGEILSRYGKLLNIIGTRIDFEMILHPEDEE
jgi:hypothetical protein